MKIESSQNNTFKKLLSLTKSKGIKEEGQAFSCWRENNFGNRTASKNF